MDAAEKYVNVTVWRTGPDLSQDSRVTLRLTPSHGPAVAGTNTGSGPYSSGESSHNNRISINVYPQFWKPPTVSITSSFRDWV